MLDQPRTRCSRGQRTDPRMPASGVRTPTIINAPAGRWRVVFAKRTAVLVIVVKPGTDERCTRRRHPSNSPSLKTNQAARNQNVFRNFLASAGRSISYSRAQEPRTSASRPACSPFEARDSAAGSQRAAGKVKIPHQIPEAPMASRRLRVDPFIRVTGTKVRLSRAIPAAYPIAMPWDEIREVARESVVL